MARIHGKSGEVKMDKTGGATLVAVASLSKWSLDLARDRVKVTAFGDTNHQYVQGLPDIKGAVSGWWDSTDRVFFEVALGEIAAMLNLVPSKLEPTFFFAGKAYLDAKIDVDVNGAVSVSGSFVAAGPWTVEPDPEAGTFGGEPLLDERQLGRPGAPRRTA